MYVDNLLTISIVVAAWMISLSMAILIYRKSRLIEDKISDLWNMKVELRDLNGEVLKVPIRYQVGQDEEGNPVFETRMEVAPLWYTIMFAAGNLAVEQFKMWFNNQKSHLSKKLSKEALADAVQGGGGDIGMLMSFLPVKAQKFIAGALAVKQISEAPKGRGQGNSATGSTGAQK